MARKRSPFGSLFRRRAEDGRPVPPSYKGKTKPGYYARINAGGRDVWRKAGNTLEEANAYLAKVKRGYFEQRVLGVDPIENVRFEVFAEEYLAAVARTHRPTTVANEENKARTFLIPHFKGRFVSSIVRRDIERFIEKRALTVGIASINRDLSLLSAMFRKAIALGYTRENPVHGFRRPKEEARAFPYVDLAGQRALIDACAASIKPIVLLALDTGLRQGELLALEWPDVDLGRRVLCVRISKNKRPRELPLTERAAVALRDLEQSRGAVPIEGPNRVFAWIPKKWAGHTRKLFKVAARAVTLPDLRFHDLRHLFGSNLAQMGVPLPDIAKLMGHTTMAMVMRYASHTPGDSGGRAIAILNGALKKRRKASS